MKILELTLWGILGGILLVWGIVHIIPLLPWQADIGFAWLLIAGITVGPWIIIGLALRQFTFEVIDRIKK
jgi:hypothetical protein